MVTVIPIETPKLGDRTYVVYDGADALVIDPQRDIDRILHVAADAGVRIRAVFETHVHNDYVTGGRALAKATGAAYYLNADDPVSFERTGVRDGDVIAVTPTLSMQAVLTPGHTFTHLSYLLREDDHVVAAFTGGSLLFGSVGRPDLLGEQHTEELARAQHRSARRLADSAPDSTAVHPTHGFGSFCSASQSDASESTLGEEKTNNPVLTEDLDSFVRQLIAGLDSYPSYYAHMADINLNAPPEPPDLTAPPAAAAADLRRRIDAGEWVVDLRNRSAFARGHLPGTFNFGIDGSFVTYLGWTIPWGTPLTLISDAPEHLVDAQRELVRIGIDRLAATAVGSPQMLAGDVPTSTLRRVTFADLAMERQQRSVVVLDVRRKLEWTEQHIAGATHIPLHELHGRISDVPAGEVWVHCGTGYRASIAASMLTAAGRRAVVVDDDWTNARDADVPLVTPDLPKSA